MHNSIMHFLDNLIIYKSAKTEEIIKYPVPDGILKCGRIHNIKSFRKYYKKLLVENKINGLLTNGNIIIVINDLYTEADKKVLKEICIENNFQKINFINENKVFKLSKNKVYVNYNHNYVLIHKKIMNSIITTTIVNSSDIEGILLKEVKNKEVYFYGNIENLDLFTKSKFYFYSEFKEIIINILKEDKKLYKNS
ncbi:MAG: hypothetical protein R3Y13_03375 [bacterium]